MINRDYILRMIEQLATFLRRAVLLKEAKEFHESVAEIKKAGKVFLGLNQEAMDNLSAQDLLRLWSVGNDLDAEKCALAGQIFRAEGEIFESQGDADRAWMSYEKALTLVTETINFLREKIPNELVSTVDFLTSHLDLDGIPVPILKKLFITYGTVGRFSNAEDTLFDIVEADPSFVPDGKRFYEHLLKKSDEELKNGNLPREEVLESLEQLNHLG